MSTSAAHRRRAAPWLAVVVVLVGALASFAAPATAAPDDDPDGSSVSLQDKLDAAARAYVDAKQTLDASRRRQSALTEQLKLTEQKLVALQAEVGAVAAAAYRGNRFVVASVLLDGDRDSATLLHDTATVQHLVWRDDHKLREYAHAAQLFAQQRAELTGEIKLQEQHVTALAKAKADAERALGKSDPADGPAGGPGSATPAPRNRDGSWPGESCAVRPDPTTRSGCLTPRTNHALQQAKAAGFGRHVSCYRGGTWGEHPKGRACDWAAQKNGFGGHATGGDLEYGNRLAGWFLSNANRLGVLYIIWNRRIWMAGSGWKTYSCGGDPSSCHTNHVHTSIY